jgi:hypothetical protein
MSKHGIGDGLVKGRGPDESGADRKGDANSTAVVMILVVVKFKPECSVHI